ncbi:hypothetical protein PVAND_016005 [Polypedilum vanderplanki]|uniref:VWFA domain-containing protein n=1 Tax=Polypedilum vanderplanki TaxID=319348 RepID=A0A9J6BEL7_POLVA|nr:hypothetical protein PVAND_016005 [Polypedilum vanderplanki]
MINVNYQNSSMNPQEKRKLETVVILDISGSMKNAVKDIITKILPSFFKKLDYDENDEIHLITFNDNAEHYKMKVKDLKNSKIISNGWTKMLRAVEKFKLLLQEFNKTEIDAVRLLTISDEQIQDKNETLSATNELKKLSEGFSILINSQAIRWGEYADTDALCSLLVLGSIKNLPFIETKIKNYADNFEQIIKNWTRPIKNDQLTTFRWLESDVEIFLKFPWNENPLKRVRVFDGENTVWLTDLPNHFTFDGMNVTVNEVKNLTYDDIFGIIKGSLCETINVIKQRKILSTEEAKETIQLIVDYFIALEIEIPPPKDTKKISEVLEKLANEKLKENMTEKQKAEYLNKNDCDDEIKKLEPTKGDPNESTTTIKPQNNDVKIKEEEKFVTTPIGMLTVAIASFIGALVVFGVAFTVPMIIVYKNM